MQRMRWLKLHLDIVDDPKLKDFTGDQFRDWVYVLCLAREATEPGLIQMTVEAAAWRVRRPVDEFRRSLELFQERGMVRLGPDFIEVVHFAERQYDRPSDQPDQVRERVRRYRQGRKHDGNADVTRVKRAGNATDPDPERDPDTEGAGSPPVSPPQGGSTRRLPVFAEDTEPHRLAALLRELILQRLPGARVPGPDPPALARWAREFDLMLRVDQREPAEVEALLRWSQRDPFWSQNILSAGKLREKYDQLRLKMSAGAGRPPPRGGSLSAADLLRMAREGVPDGDES